ncbi:MAG: hypothetical protein EHM50_10415 [Lysobacterales bacterium]|nr:MAG: hypothetical protein EHM50_10415 [Xanthomonadales bacterium]
MKRQPQVIVLLAAALCAAPAAAHHSWSRYDGEHVITITGNITSIEWASPHVVVQLTVPADGAEPTPWTMEMDPPTLLNRYGLRHDTLKTGMLVKLTGVRARSGAPMMRAVTIEVEDGTVYRVSSRV